MTDSTNYEKWMDRAHQDIALLDIIHDEELFGIEESFCYICHQAAEKILKAYILKEERKTIRTHDLVFLLGICIKHQADLIRLMDDVTALNEYSVSV